MSFIVSDWFKTRPRSFTVEGIDFDLMALTESLSDDIKLCDTYDEMLSLAADTGISVEGVRVVEDEHFSKYSKEFWAKDALNVECDPCIKYRVGEEVCKISGLTSVLEDMLEKEKAEAAEAEATRADMVISGDDLTDAQLAEEMGKVQADMIAHNNAA